MLLIAYLTNQIDLLGITILIALLHHATDATFQPLLGAKFVDTHKGGKMTCTTQTQNGPSLSRIDRIFVWTRDGADFRDKRVEPIQYPNRRPRTVNFNSPSGLHHDHNDGQTRKPPGRKTTTSQNPDKAHRSTGQKRFC